MGLSLPSLDQTSGREDKDVPRKLRAEVVARDGSCCRVCGRFVEQPALHHIDYRSSGGRHRAENLVVIGWLPWHDCHLPVVHANKRLWQPILEAVVLTPGVTAFSLRRQLEAAGQLPVDSDNGRSRLGRPASSRPPRVERPLAGWPSAEAEAFRRPPDDPISGPSAK